MKKSIKKLTSILCITTILIGLETTTTNAEEIEVCGPGCIDTSYYVPQSTNIQNKVARSGYLKNDSSGTITQSYSFKREFFSSISGGVGYESSKALSLITGKLGLHSEVSAGTSYVETRSSQIKAPAYSNIYFELGTVVAKTTGYIEHVSSNCSVSKSSVSSSFTTGDYIYSKDM